MKKEQIKNKYNKTIKQQQSTNHSYISFNKRYSSPKDHSKLDYPSTIPRKYGHFLQVYTQPSNKSKLASIANQSTNKNTFINQITDFCACVSNDEGNLIKTKQIKSIRQDLTYLMQSKIDQQNLLTPIGSLVHLLKTQEEYK